MVQNVAAQIKLARANLPLMLSNPRESIVSPITEWMKDPMVFEKSGWLIRIWRSPIEEIESHYRRRSAVIETTQLDSEILKPNGLHWSYSRNSRKYWGESDWIMHGHYPGDQPCIDLFDVYRSITYEIRYVIDRLQGIQSLRESRRKRRKNNE